MNKIPSLMEICRKAVSLPQVAPPEDQEMVQIVTESACRQILQPMYTSFPNIQDIAVLRNCTQQLDAIETAQQQRLQEFQDSLASEFSSEEVKTATTQCINLLTNISIQEKPSIFTKHAIVAGMALSGEGTQEQEDARLALFHFFRDINDLKKLKEEIIKLATTQEGRDILKLITNANLDNDPDGFALQERFIALIWAIGINHGDLELLQMLVEADVPLTLDIACRRDILCSIFRSFATQNIGASMLAFEAYPSLTQGLEIIQPSEGDPVTLRNFNGEEITFDQNECFLDRLKQLKAGLPAQAVNPFPIVQPEDDAAAIYGPMEGE